MVFILTIVCLTSGLGDWYSNYSSGDWLQAREEAMTLFSEDSTSAVALAALSLSSHDDMSEGSTSLDLATKALHRDSTLALAWAALGMSVLQTDPILAIEALTRAVEIDSSSAVAWEGLGIAMLDSGEYSLAAANMQHAIEADSSYMPAWLGHAMVLDESGDPEGGLFVLDIALSRWPRSTALLFQKAWIQEWLFPADSALVTYGRILEVDPGNVDALKYKGLVHEELYQWGRAIKTYRVIVDADSTYFWAHGEIAYCFEQLAWFDFAEDWYLKGLEVNPSYAWAAYRIGLIARSTDLDESLEWFTLATELNPRMADAWVEKGLVYEDTGDFSAAVSCLQTALDIDPDDYWAWGELGYLLKELGRFEEAAEAYENGVAANSGYVWGWQQRGLLYEDSGEYTEAISWFRLAIGESGGSSWLFGELGAMLETEGDMDSAAICFQGAIELDSCYTFGLHRLAHIRRIEGRSDEALELLAAYLQCGGDTVTARSEAVLTLEQAGRESEADSIEQVMLDLYPDAWLDAAWNSFYMDDDDEAYQLCQRFEAGGPVESSQWVAVADLYSFLGRDDQSDRCYVEATLLDPSDIDSWVAWGSMLSAVDRFSEASERLDRAIGIDSTFIEAWSVLGEALLFDNRYYRAEEALQKVLELDPGSVYALCYIGLIRERSGKPLEALDYYLEALELSPGYHYAEDRIRAISDPAYDSEWWARDEGMFDASLWFDLSVIRGNTEEKIMSAGASLTMKYDNRGSSVMLEGGGMLEERWEKETRNTAWASLEADYFISDAFYIEASSTWDRQPITVRPWQISSYLAGGYKRWISDWLWVAPEIGVGLVSSSWSLGHERTDDVTAYGSFGIWFEKTGSILPEVWLAGSVYLPPKDKDDLVAFGDAEITFRIWHPLSLTLGYSVDYTRKPVVSEWERYDTEVFTRIRLELF